MENNGKIVVFVIVASALGLIGGYYFGYNQGNSVGYETARTEIRARLEDRGIVQPVPKDIRAISGVIKSIGDGQFVLESRTQFDSTLSEGEQSNTISKTVLVSPATVITIITMEENTMPPKAGEPFIPIIKKSVMTDFSSLKVSDAVTVEAGENILDKSSFGAIFITKDGR